MQLSILDAFTGGPSPATPAAVMLPDDGTWPPGQSQSASLDERCA
jgi:hypothetical protein